MERLGSFDIDRLRKAFDNVESTVTRWPAPADIIKQLPAYAQAWQQLYYRDPAVPLIESEEEKKRSEEQHARISKMLDEAAKRFAPEEPAPPKPRLDTPDAVLRAAFAGLLKS